MVIGAGVIALIAIWLFIDERQRLRKKESLIEKLNQEKESFKKAYLELLTRYLKDEKSMTPDLVEEINKLKNNTDNLDADVHVELDSVLNQMKNGKGSKAVKDLAKIVENELKKKVRQDHKFKQKPMLHNLLKYARDCNWISKLQFENGLKLKDIRNKESHELAVRVNKRELGLTLFAGIDLLYALN